jgi:hypothetical protein
LKPGGVSFVRRYWLLAGLFIIIFHHPGNFEVAKTGASARFSLAPPGGFALRACVSQKKT